MKMLKRADMMHANPTSSKNVARGLLCRLLKVEKV
jgi:hypothetical protein